METSTPNIVHLKVSLTREHQPPEIRRLTMNKGSSVQYNYLVQKLCTTFSIPDPSEISISWEDCDGDPVVIGTDEELKIALMEMKGHCKRLNLTITPEGPPFSSPAPHEPMYGLTRELAEILEILINLYHHDPAHFKEISARLRNLKGLEANWGAAGDENKYRAKYVREIAERVLDEMPDIVDYLEDLRASNETGCETNLETKPGAPWTLYDVAGYVEQGVYLCAPFNPAVGVVAAGLCVVRTGCEIAGRFS